MQETIAALPACNGLLKLVAAECSAAHKAAQHLRIQGGVHFLYGHLLPKSYIPFNPRPWITLQPYTWLELGNKWCWSGHVKGGYRSIPAVLHMSC